LSHYHLGLARELGGKLATVQWLDAAGKIQPLPGDTSRHNLGLFGTRLAERIKALRAAEHWSQEELAERADSTVCHIDTHPSAF
jgi:hypothetical protein